MRVRGEIMGLVVPVAPCEMLKKVAPLRLCVKGQAPQVAGFGVRTQV